MKKENTLDYGNWVPVKMIVIPALLSLISLLIGLKNHGFLVGFVMFGVIALYFGISSYIFSKDDKRFQDQVEQLVMDHITWDGKGKALDIGCGNAPLSIKLAKKFPTAKVTGIDYWGKNWDYSMQVCQKNAEVAGVSDRVDFQHGSASSLPFDDDTFDLVVSNLVFHEVQDVKDKRIPLHEALRVLKPGGIFVLQDLFLLKAYFGTPQDLISLLRSWGVKEVEFIKTCDEDFIPGLVKLPFMVGALAILKGVK